MVMTFPTDTLVCDTVQTALWRSRPEYAYHNELLTPEINVFEWIGLWLGEHLGAMSRFRWVADYSEYILIGIALLFLLLVCWFVYRKKPRLFMTTQRSVPYVVTEDTIYGVDFSKEIARALSREEYREAVRLLYLQTLRQLSDAGRIDWQLYKTPTQYFYEVRMPAFRQLTNHFLRVRYGNFAATEELFRAMQTLQQEIEKGGNS